MIGGHLRPRSLLPLNILMGLALAPQTGEPSAAPPNLVTHTLHGSIGRGGDMSCWHRCITRGERGQSRWRIGWQWSILVVVCCVLWLWVVGLQVEYCNVTSTLVKWQKQSSTQNCWSCYRGIVCPLQPYQVYSFWYFLSHTG